MSAVRLAAIERLVPKALAKVRGPFEGVPSRPFDVVVHRSLDALPEALRSELHPGTPGFAMLGRDEVHLVLDEVQLRPPHDLTTVLAHELVHLLIDQYAGEFAPTVPRWVHEGLAQHLSGETYLGAREDDLLYPAAVGRLSRFRDLARAFPEDEAGRLVAYAQSESFVSFLVRKVGVDVVVEAIRRSTELDGYVGGFALRAGTPLGWFEDEWLLWVRDESGARWRFFFQNCFSYSMIGGLVLLALALIRRLERDDRARRKLLREEQDLEQAESEDTAP